MKPLVFICIVTGLLMTACKKGDVEVDSSATSGGSGQTPVAGRPASGPGSPAEVKASEEAAQKALAAKDYDAAVANMIKVTQQKSLSDDEANRLRDLNSRLLNASQSDPKAMEAYRNMSAAMRGR